jgi:hypothetical protein
VSVLVALAVLGGCAHGHEVARDLASLEALDERLRDRQVTLTLVDGSTRTVWDVAVRPDSTHWQLECVSGPLTIATSQVREITIRNRARGALDGLLIGFLVGAPLGAGLMDNPDGPANDLLNRAEAGAAGGLAFAAVGAPIGAIVGSRLRYRLAAEAPTSGGTPDAPAAPPRTSPDRSHRPCHAP